MGTDRSGVKGQPVQIQPEGDDGPLVEGVSAFLAVGTGMENMCVGTIPLGILHGCLSHPLVPPREGRRSPLPSALSYLLMLHAFFTATARDGAHWGVVSVPLLPS